MRVLSSLSAILLTLAIVSPAAAQEARDAAQDQAVLAVVTDFYSALRRGDQATVQTLFHPQAWLFVSLESGDGTVEAVQSVAEFVRASQQPPAGWWNVQLIDPVAQVSESVAVVWANFIYQDRNQRRYGIETYQLARAGDRWRIVSIANRSQQSGCEAGVFAAF